MITSKFQKKAATWIIALLVPVAANAFNAGDTIRVKMGEVAPLDIEDFIEFVWIPESSDYRKGKGGFWMSKYMIHQGVAGLDLAFFHCSSGLVNSELPLDRLDQTDVRIILSQLNEDKRLRFTIPSARQWQWATTAGAPKIYKHQIWDYAWLAENSKGRLHPNGAKMAFPSGVHDLIGNVAEWCRPDDLFVLTRETEKSLVTLGAGFDGHYNDAFKPEASSLRSLYGGLRLCVDPVGYDNLKSGDTLVLTRNPRIIRNTTGRQYWTDRVHFYDEAFKSAAQEEGIPFVKIKSETVAGGPGQETFNSCWWLDLDRLPSSVPRADLIKLHNVFNEVLNAGEELFAKTEEAFKCRLGRSERDYQDNFYLDSANMWYDFAFRTCWQFCNDDEFWQDILEGKSSKAIETYNSELRGAKTLLNLKIEMMDLRISQNERTIEEQGPNVANKTSMKIGEIYSRYKNCLAVVNTERGSGSGFVVRSYGTVYFYTNKHVIDGCKKCKITVIGNRRVKLRDAEVATNTDIARGIVQSDYMPQGDILEFESAQPILGEKIYVIGNSDGLGVQTLLEGKIIGVTPDLSIIEIDAPIVHGNSGSPVLNECGKVVGVASFATKGEGAEVRRFAIRPQAGVTWKPRAK